MFLLHSSGGFSNVAVNDVVQAKEAGERDQACVNLSVMAYLVENIPGMI